MGVAARVAHEEVAMKKKRTIDVLATITEAITLVAGGAPAHNASTSTPKPYPGPPSAPVEAWRQEQTRRHLGVSDRKWQEINSDGGYVGHSSGLYFPNNISQRDVYEAAKANGWR
jgi:hypothetical protein